MDHPPTVGLARTLVLLLSVTAGTSVAALYYAQPLLADIAASLHTSTTTAGLLVSASQLGYVLGLAFVVPLGDTVERRRLVMTMLVLGAVGSLLAAVSSNLVMLLVVLVFTGVTAAAAMVVVPMAAGLASAADRGRVTGTVMSGLLLGILLARTASGAIAAVGGWRSVFVVAAALELLLAVAVRHALPSLPPSAPQPYRRLLASIVVLVRSSGVLRGRMVLGALSMCSFSMMWTAITFLLARQWHYHPATIGLFGLAGAAGACAAPLIGRLADRGHADLGTTLSWLALVGGWALLLAGGHHLGLLIGGLLLFDLGAQAAQVSNQHRIYALDATARGRITTAYMVSFFLGGVVGSVLATLLYGRGGWTLMCILGVSLGTVGLGVWGLLQRTIERRAASQ